MIAEAINRMLPRSTRPGPGDDFWYRPTGSIATSGVVVNVDSSLHIATVYACVNLLAELLGSLSFRVYEKTGAQKRGRKLAEDYWLDRVLYDRPNRWQTSQEWRELLIRHALLEGNFYNVIVPRGGGEVELVPRMPNRMKVEQVASNYLRYTYVPPEGGPPEVYDAERIFHVRGYTLDGINGVSVLKYAKNSVGLASAQETHGAGQFKNGGIPPFYIKRPAAAPQWNKTGAKENFRASWRKIVAGPENAGNPPILEDGMEIAALSINNEQLQWIESQGFSGAQICRFFRVPPWAVGLDKPPTDTEQAMNQLVKLTLRPWAGRMESFADCQLVDDDRYYTKVSLDEIDKAAMLNRFEANNIGVQGGWLTRNECRLDEDRDPLPGLDEPLEALNMQPAGSGPDWNEQGGQPGKGRPVRRRQESNDEADGDGAADAHRADNSWLPPLLADAASRIAGAEIVGIRSRATKAANDRAKWKTFIGEFYASHVAYAMRTIEPIALSWKAGTGCEIDSVRIADALWAMAEDANCEDVPGLLVQWESQRSRVVLGVLNRTFGLNGDPSCTK